MVNDIFNVISSGVTAFGQCLVSGVSAMTQIVYDTSGTTPQLTFVGTMLLLAISFGIVYWIFRLIRGLTAGVNH